MLGFVLEMSEVVSRNILNLTSSNMCLKADKIKIVHKKGILLDKSTIWKWIENDIFSSVM